MGIFLDKDISNLPIVDTTKIVHFGEKLLLGSSKVEVPFFTCPRFMFLLTKF